MLSAAGSTMLCACDDLPRSGGAARHRRVVVLAFDGLDPRIVRGLMDLGRMPNFTEVAQRGGFTSLATSTPPITPVAFSSIISGTDPGTHAIFDFIHRDPNPAGSSLAVTPYFSLATTVEAKHDWALPLGAWRLPLSGGTAKSLRRGPTFWDALTQRGTDVGIYHLPGTFPPPSAVGDGQLRCLAGMGTPDLLGTYGEFTVFATDERKKGRRVGGGKFVRLDLTDHHGTALLEGPVNFLKELDDAGKPNILTVEIRITRDPESAVVKIEVGDELILLAEGEWSDWVHVDFETGIPCSTALSAMQAPTSIGGMVRFYVKQVHPELRLYASPANLDPIQPANPISTPRSLARDLARRNGRFYTTGIPEDTKALSRGALNEDEFLAQTDLVLTEKIREYHSALTESDRGCLFSYFGTPDLVQHMFWRDRDPDHPGRLPEQGDRYADVIDNLYIRMDQVVGETLATLRDDDLLMILSDHGFTTFRREVSINTFLLENGYITLIDPSRQGKTEYLLNVDWSRTIAYAMGLNGLYINLEGREKYGIISTEERQSLLDEIKRKLMDLRDDDGSRVIEKIYPVSELYPDADPHIAPDMIIGYAEGYRASWATALGGIPREIIVDNRDRWSGTHCIAPHLLPGILLATEPIAVDDPTLLDIAPTILGAFGVKPPAPMKGRLLLA